MGDSPSPHLGPSYCPDTIICRHPPSAVGVPCKKQCHLYRGSRVTVQLTGTHFAVKRAVQFHTTITMRYRRYQLKTVPMESTTRTRIIRFTTDMRSRDDLTAGPSPDFLIGLRMRCHISAAARIQRESQRLTIPL